MLLTKSEIEESISIIPELPGCYTYRDAEGVVLYLSLIHIFRAHETGQAISYAVFCLKKKNKKNK